MNLPIRILRLSWIVGLLAGGWLGPAARAGVPQAQVDCFQMQFLLRLPDLESLHLINDVASLQKDLDIGIAPTAERIALLRAEANNLRTEERLDYLRLGALLSDIGAPQTLKKWVADQTNILSQPPKMSKDEQKDAKSDPDTATILATLDECDARKAEVDNLLPTVGAWIHVSYGPQGLWAADVGEMTAALQVSIAAQKAPSLVTSLPRHLAVSAPARTPTAILSALQQLETPSGNLSGLASATSAIPVPVAAQAHDDLLAAFASQNLASLTGV